MGAIKLVSFVVRLGFWLALMGQLKFCTLVMMGKAEMFGFSPATRIQLKKLETVHRCISYLILCFQSLSLLRRAVRIKVSLQY